jgi:urease accessory protein
MNAQFQLHQRAVGSVQVGVRLSERGTALAQLHQAGCLRARFPRPHGGMLEAVLVNTAGGVTDGDVLTLRLDAAAGSAMTVSTPSAERIYRALPGAAPARIEIDVQVAAGARVDYLPQETILFDRCALDRSLRIDLHPAGMYLGVEALLFGRPLSGEMMRQVSVRDRISLLRGGRLVLQDAVRLQGEVQSLLATRASAAGAAAVATILFAAPDAEAALDAVRAALEGADAGASAWDGILMARIVAPDGQALRRVVVAVLGVLRSESLPRLWAL